MEFIKKMAVNPDIQVIWNWMLSQPGMTKLVYTIDANYYEDEYLLRVFTMSNQNISLSYYKEIFKQLPKVAENLGISWIVIYRCHNDPEYSGEPIPQIYFKKYSEWKFGTYDNYVEVS